LNDVWWQLIKGKVLTTPPPPGPQPRPIPSVGEVYAGPGALLDFDDILWGISERARQTKDMGGDHTLWHYYNVVLPAKRQKQYNQYIAEQKRKEEDKANPPKPVGVKSSV